MIVFNKTSDKHHAEEDMEMEQMTDIEIAQSCEMKPIGEIAEAAGIPESYLEYYGR